MDSALAAIIGAGVGSFISGLSMVIITRINKKSEERRHKREVAVRLSTEEYREHFQEARRKGKGVVSPPQIYFIFALKFLNEIDPSKTPEEIAKQFKKINKESKELGDLIKS